MTVRTLKVFYCDVEQCTATATVEPGKGAPPGWSITSNKRQHRCPEHLLVRCGQCGRLMRTNRMLAADHPNTVLAYRNDLEDPLCRSCHAGRQPVQNVSEKDAKFIRRLVASRFDDPDDRLLVLDRLGLLGSDTD